MSLCKPLTTIMLGVESESKNGPKDRTQPQEVETTTEPNALPVTAIKRANRTKRSLTPSHTISTEKKTTRLHKTSRKNDTTVPTDITLPFVQNNVASPESESDNVLDQKKLIDFGFTTQVQAILLAIKENRAVELFFIDSESNPPRVFEPRQLIFDAFAKDWYIWGWDRRYNTERHHLLALIDNINVIY